MTNITMMKAMCTTMSLGLCASVELGGGDRRQEKSQVETCRTDGPGVVKDGREAWTDEPGGRVTSRSG